MDDIQKLLVKMIDEQPSCINDRKQLKAVLSDYLPQNKLQQNLILNAYDEDIVNRLKPSSDVTLHALQMVKILSDGYGLTNDAAMWSVISWCQILKFGEVADAIEHSFQSPPNASPQANNNQIKPTNTTVLGCAVYKAGVDLPIGELRLKVDPTAKVNVYYGISKNPNRLDTDKSFSDQTYIILQDGYFLLIECFDTSTKYTITATLV